MPKKLQWCVLLLASIAYYLLSGNGILILYPVLTCLTAWLCTRQIGKVQEQSVKRIWMIAAVCLLIGLMESAAAGIIPGIGALLVVGPLEYGMAYIFLKQARDHQPVQMGDMFRGFQDDFGGTFLIGLMTSLFTFLWSLLFVIPGIVKAYAYSMAYYIKLDHPDYGWNACITASRQLMNGHKWEKFVLDLSFLGWIIVGSLCLGVGTLWVTPYMEAANAQFYEYVRTCPSVAEG